MKGDRRVITRDTAGGLDSDICRLVLVDQIELEENSPLLNANKHR